MVQTALRASRIAVADHFGHQHTNDKLVAASGCSMLPVVGVGIIKRLWAGSLAVDDVMWEWEAGCCSVELGVLDRMVAMYAQVLCGHGWLLVW